MMRIKPTPEMYKMAKLSGKTKTELIERITELKKALSFLIDNYPDPKFFYEKTKEFFEEILDLEEELARRKKRNKEGPK